jgi:hypothetical protein
MALNHLRQLLPCEAFQKQQQFSWSCVSSSGVLDGLRWVEKTAQQAAAAVAVRTSCCSRWVAAVGVQAVCVRSLTMWCQPRWGAGPMALMLWLNLVI